MQISFSLANRFEEQGHLANALCLYYNLYLQQPNNVEFQTKVNLILEKLIKEEETPYNILMKKIFSPGELKKFAILPSKAYTNYNEMRAKLEGKIEIKEEFASENEINEEELIGEKEQNVPYDETKVKEYAKEVFKQVLDQQQKDSQINCNQNTFANKEKETLAENNKFEDIKTEELKNINKENLADQTYVELEKNNKKDFTSDANSQEKLTSNNVSSGLLDLRLSELSGFLFNLLGEDKQLKDLTLKDIIKFFK